MNQRTNTGRTNQRHRTRKDLLAAAGRLLKEGKSPTMDDVAAAALVSRATAYRYFPRIEALLVEATLDDDVPSPESLFANDDSTDVAERVDRAEAALHAMCCRNEPHLRAMLAASLTESRQDGVPVRQNRRTPLIEAALEPAKRKMSRADYQHLRAALALVFGTESMIVFRDVLGVDAKTARRVKRWAIRALVAAALDGR